MLEFGNFTCQPLLKGDFKHIHSKPWLCEGSEGTKQFTLGGIYSKEESGERGVSLGR